MTALLSALALALTSPAPAPAAQKLLWGPTTLLNGQSAFPMYKKLGVDVLQIQLPWSSVAATRPQQADSARDPAYHWPTALDDAVQQAQRYHINLLLMVKSTPAWANGGRDPGWAPTDPADYANFLKAASRRYPYVRYWMVWGEPTRAGNFEPMSPKSSAGPRRYAVLLDAAYGALKSVNPHDIVIGGNTWTAGVITPPKFLEEMKLPNGRPPRLDFWGHNPFSRRYPNLADRPYFPGVRDINDVDTLAGEVRHVYAGTGRKPRLWLSEWTISSDRANRGYDYFVSRKAQARWISAAFKLADHAPYVAGLGWYSLYDDPPSIKKGLTTGLLTYDGKPKPAFRAYEHAK